MTGKKKSLKHKQTKLAKVVPINLAKMSVDQVREHIEGLIAGGSPKEAIHTLQQLHLGDSAELGPVRMKAYAARARQLNDKGLEKEASLLLDTLSLQLSEASGLECSRIAQIIGAAPVEFAVKYYEEQHQKLHPDCPWIERALADQLVVSKRWEMLSRLPEDHSLKRDGRVVADAMDDLDAARWQEGLAKLEPLSRRSAFAPWKLFAKAVSSAYKGEEEDLKRALKQIPEDFPLHSTLRVLREKGCAGLESLHERVRKPDTDMARAIVDAIRRKDHRLSHLIPQFAQRLFPKNPPMALRSLSETAAFALSKKDIDPERISKLIPPTFSKPILMRLEMFSAPEMDSDVFPFCLAAQYMKNFDLEAPYVGEKEKVEAAVYFFLFMRILALNTSLWTIPSKDRSCLIRWLGGDRELKWDDLYAATVEKITRLVPDVDAYYSVVKDIPIASLSNKGRELLDLTLARMRKQFPENPFSYLQLARLYRGKGAYRKSQKILEEAWKQAPYDPQVREYYALGLLKASSMSRKRKTLALGKKDLEEAVGLNVKSLLPLTQAMQSSLEFFERGVGTPAKGPLASLLAVSDPVLRFRSLMCFYQDLSESADAQAQRFAKLTKDRILKELKNGLKRLGESELAEIIAPFPEDFEDIIGRFGVPDFFNTMWSQIFARFDDQHVLGIYARLLADEEAFAQLKWVKSDLKLRLRRQRKNVFLRFFSALVEYRLDPGLGSDEFYELIDYLKEDEIQKLKEFCRKIASVFDEPLSSALGSFNFDILDEDDMWYEEPDFFEDDDKLEWGEEDFEPDEFPFSGIDPTNIIIEGLKKTGGSKDLLQYLFEMLVSEMSSFGVDDESLRDMGRALEKQGREIVQQLRQIYSGKHARPLKRAGRLILFPDSK